jgi:hypothetical protein
MRRRGDWLLVGAGLVLVVGAGVVLVEVFRLTPSERSDVFGLWGFALALAGAVVSVLGWLRRVRSSRDPRTVSTLADLLSQGVHGQWRKAAAERVLLTPAPIPVHWSLSSLPVTGDLTAALNGPFNPLPGLTAVTEVQLQAGGSRCGLFAVYAGLASGRVVVVGGPGSGKSGSAILLLLDALEHREQLGDTERARVPVPVLFPVHGWDPASYSAQDWLAAQLAATYPLFQHRGGPAEAAALVAAGAIALILDGLDEMDQTARPAALQALSDVPFRVVVLTRSQEMIQAARAAWLTGAAALQLHDVAGAEGADYLQRARAGPAPSGWSQLLAHLRQQPDSVLTRGLSTPLALTLIRDTYQTGDDLGVLLNASSFSTAEDLEQHLIARVLSAAYTPRPGRPKPRYSLAQATQALTFIARQMDRDDTRDLAWWHIPRWAPTIPRILASILAGGLLGGLLTVLVREMLGRFLRMLSDAIQGYASSGPSSDWLTWVFAIGFGIGLPFGVWYGRGGRAPKRVKNWRALNIGSILTGGLVHGLAGGTMVRIAELAVFSSVRLPGPAAVLVIGLLFGLVARPVGVLAEGVDRPQTLRERWRNDRVVVLVFGTMVGLTLLYGYLHSDESGPVVVLAPLVFGLASALMYWVVSQLAAGLATRLVEGEEKGPQGPRESWRNDRAVGVVVGIVFGPAVGLGYALAGPTMLVINSELVFRSVLAVGLVVGLGAGIAVGLLYGITSSATWPTTLAWLQLQCSRHIPAVRLMPFLEDAQARGLLRTVGTIYQFRHATLQDHLAARTALSPTTF